MRRRLVDSSPRSALGGAALVRLGLHAELVRLLDAFHAPPGDHLPVLAEPRSLAILATSPLPAVLAEPLATDSLGGAVPAEVPLPAVRAGRLGPRVTRSVSASRARGAVRAHLSSHALLARLPYFSVFARDASAAPHALDDRDVVLAVPRRATLGAVELRHSVRAAAAQLAAAPGLDAVWARSNHRGPSREDGPRLGERWPGLALPRTLRGGFRRRGGGFLRRRGDGFLRRRRRGFLRRRRRLSPGFPSPALARRGRVGCEFSRRSHLDRRPGFGDRGRGRSRRGSGHRRSGVRREFPRRRSGRERRARAAGP
mmetsp:Transcript_9912/g.43179  ORF Transcript_9912/g.43179 Transcript_9912/m.43179 type:complete len:313 (+) Transcript_9912:1265-2203(+)